MSADAAKAFGISKAEMQTYLGGKSISAVSPAIDISAHAKHVILVVSVFLFVVAFFTFMCTLLVWALSRRKKKEPAYTEIEKTEKAELACDEDSLNEAVKSTPSLPQIFDKPKMAQHSEIYSKEPFAEEELRKISIEKMDLSANFYPNRNQLQVNVRRVDLKNVDESLSQNAFIYLVVSLLPETTGNSDSFYESDLRPVAEENYFEESSHFDIESDDVVAKTLKVAIFASDRFSQHRLVSEFVYKLSVDIDTEAETPAVIVPVKLTEESRRDNNELPEKVSKDGEVLFSLCYMPTSGRLTFVALKGRNLCSKNENPIATYLRVSLLVSGKTMKTVQTTSVRKSSTPVYNEAFVFHTPLERIKDTDIIVSVMTSDDSNTSSTPQMLGKLIVGPESDNNLGRKHWEAMLTSPRRPVAQWHCISEYL